jgi:hypothetical protein
MSSVCTRGFAAGLLFAISWCSAAQAIPVELQYSGIVSDTTVTGVSPGDTITFDVFADNGGSSLISQTWSVTDITSATITAGTYSATTSGPVSGLSSGSFTTNSSGFLATLSFSALFQNGTDTNGATLFSYYMNGGNPIWFEETFGNSFNANVVPNIDNTTISLVPTPLPAAFPLFATGIGGLGLLGWRRKRKARAI